MMVSNRAAALMLASFVVGCAAQASGPAAPTEPEGDDDFSVADAIAGIVHADDGEAAPEARGKGLAGPWVALESSPGASELEPGAAALAKGDAKAARPLLEAAIVKLGDGAAKDAVLAAHALLGRARSELGDAAGAAKAYEVVRGRFDAATLEALPNDDAKKRAVLAAGEALLFDAEEKRAAAAKPVFPSYRGDTKRASIDAFVAGDVSTWVKEKEALLAAAEAAFTKVLDLEPGPAPAAAVHASARIAQMRGYFAAQFRAAPIPAAWRGAGASAEPGASWADVRKRYYAAMDEASAPQGARAREAYAACVALARELTVDDEFARSCTAWVEKQGERAAE